ncbi:MAG: LysR family transcriptional regulator [Lachnospiraceae bacterium]|nr:LysR family transcriptional regulator [Lachnospiraceae bacterium]
MNSDKILQFKMIAQYENITRASEALFISAPALSKTLSKIEAELGCHLFERKGKRLLINENGRKLLEFANQMEGLLKQIDRAFASAEDRELFVYSICNFFSFIMENYFRESVRSIHYELVQNHSIPDLFFHKDADVVVSDDFFMKSKESDQVMKMPVLNEQLLLSVPAENPLAQKRSINIKELNGMSIMRTSDIKGVNDWVEKILELNHVKVRWALTLDAESYHDLLASDLVRPIIFESSSQYMSSKEYRRNSANRRSIKVTGEYTNRMISVWYNRAKQAYLEDFIRCIRESFC